MAGAKAVLVNLALLFKYVSTVLILDCGPANVSTIEGRTVQLHCTGINAADNVEWRHVISGGTANEIIVSTCQDQNLCKDNSHDRYRATRPTGNTSVMTIVSVSRDDTRSWTCLAGVEQATCSLPAAIYPADVMEQCQIVVTEDSVKVTCTILKAFPSPSCTWFECFVPKPRLGNLNNTTDCQISPDQTYLEPPTTFVENGTPYFNTSCWVFKNITQLVGTLNYTVVISPGLVVRSSVVTVTSGPVSPTLTVVSICTPGVTLTSGSSSSTVDIAPSSTTMSESTWPSTRPQLSPVGSALVPDGIIGIAVGSVLFVAIVTAVIYVVLTRRHKKTQEVDERLEGITEIRQDATHQETPMTVIEQPADYSGENDNEGEYDEILDSEEETLPSHPSLASLPALAPTDGSNQYMTLVNDFSNGEGHYQSLTAVNSSTNTRTDETELFNCTPPAPHCPSTSNDDYLVPAPVQL